MLPVPYDVPEVPQAPSNRLPPVESLDPVIQRLIRDARSIMEERPIFTRRALINSLPAADSKIIVENSSKQIYQYIGYGFASGPWRDCIVRFGVDPRKDRKYRKYQAVMFMLESEPKDNRAKYNRTKPPPPDTDESIHKKSHLFDGKSVQKDGKVWQVCDISDPILKELLDTDNLRDECNVSYSSPFHSSGDDFFSLPPRS